MRFVEKENTIKYVNVVVHVWVELPQSCKPSWLQHVIGPWSLHGIAAGACAATLLPLWVMCCCWTDFKGSPLWGQVVQTWWEKQQQWWKLLPAIAVFPEASHTDVCSFSWLPLNGGEGRRSDGLEAAGCWRAFLVAASCSLSVAVRAPEYPTNWDQPKLWQLDQVRNNHKKKALQRTWRYFSNMNWN